jgi:hypothetical protein
MMGERRSATRFVSVLMGTVVGLTFLFGFGNVLTLALRLGVPVYVAPLVAPAVDLTVVCLLVATRHLAEAGAPVDVLRSARRMLLGVCAAATGPQHRESDQVALAQPERRQHRFRAQAHTPRKVIEQRARAVHRLVDGR